jgi:hypothetical protein
MMKASGKILNNWKLELKKNNGFYFKQRIQNCKNEATYFSTVYTMRVMQRGPYSKCNKHFSVKKKYRYKDILLESNLGDNWNTASNLIQITPAL